MTRMVAERQDEAAMGAHGMNSRQNEATTRASGADRGGYEDLRASLSEISRQVHVGRGEGGFSPPFFYVYVEPQGFLRRPVYSSVNCFLSLISVFLSFMFFLGEGSFISFSHVSRNTQLRT